MPLAGHANQTIGAMARLRNIRARHHIHLLSATWWQGATILRYSRESKIEPIVSLRTSWEDITHTKL